MWGVFIFARAKAILTQRRRGAKGFKKLKCKQIV